MYGFFSHAYRVVEHNIREATKGRSPHWKICRRDFLLEHPTCAACGGKKNLAVHHVRPFHLEPSLELDFTNLLTMCMGHLECHFRLAHGADYKSYNKNIRVDAEIVLKQPAMRPMLEQKAHELRLYKDPFV